MNQISFLWKPFIRIQNPVGFAIREVFAVFTEKRTSSWAFTRQIFFTFRNVSRDAAGARAYACRKDVKEDAHALGLSSFLRQRILLDHPKDSELRISWSSRDSRGLFELQRWSLPFLAVGGRQDEKVRVSLIRRTR